MLVLHQFPFLCSSLDAEAEVDSSGNLAGNEDVISLSDIIPETNISFVSLIADTLDSDNAYYLKPGTESVLHFLRILSSQ